VLPADTERPAAPAASIKVEPRLSVIVPVYNQAGSIVENVEEIRRRVASELSDPIELVVVSDGSVDLTAERLLSETHREAVRVIHYDRNLGKGFAIKAGALAARGDWISYVDADLDLDPGALPRFLEIAREEDLDFAIGSKRHPDSVVHYPLSRRVSSWLYQQLVRVLFRLDVRDTQSGLKVFRRDVVDSVFPLLLVKQFAFDLEMLAVARAFGFSRMRELPVRLDYRFTGSGVRSAAVLRALVDTAAIFYRLRILRYYQRKRAILGETTRVAEYRPTVTLVGRGIERNRLDYPSLEVVTPEDVGRAKGEVLAFVGANARPAGNWISSAVPYLARPDLSAVVTPLVAPPGGSLRERAAAAVSESRLGTGSRSFRFTPGNLRFVQDYPTSSLVVRRDDYLSAGAVEPERLCARLTELEKRVLYTPDSVVVASRPPLFQPHLKQAAQYADLRGMALRSGGIAALRPSTLAPVGIVAFVVLGWPAAFAGGGWQIAWLSGVVAYGLLIGVIMVATVLRYRSVRVGALAGVGAAATHAVYALGLLRGLARRPA
jgi:glycosyltransferase involved in cell wall biosynthesis